MSHPAPAPAPPPPAATPTADPGGGPTQMVLPAGVEAVIERGFAAAGPAVRLDGARVAADHVDATVCAGDTCARALLTAPSPCAGELAGPFCIGWPDGRPAFADAVVRAWARQPSEGVWLAVKPAPPPVTAAAASPLVPSLDAAPAWATTGGPWLLGALLAWALRRVWPRPRWLGPVVAAALWLAAAAAWQSMEAPVGLWDLGWSSLCALAGVAAVAAGPGRAALAIASTVLAFAAVEASLRTRPAPAPWTSDVAAASALPWAPIDHHASDRLGRGIDWQDYNCRMMAAAGAAHRVAAPGDTRRLVLHLGDSMIHGISVLPGQTMPALLDAADRQWRHRQGGMPGTSIDAALVLLRQWAPALQPAHVVLHIYSGNDLLELGAPYPCCGGPLVDLSAPDVPTLCGGGSAGVLGSSQLRHLVEHSPPPYAWRAAAPHLRLAAYGCRGLAAMALGSGTAWMDSLPTRVERYRHALDALRADCARLGARLHVVIAPDIRVFRGDQQAREHLEAMRGLLAAAGVAPLDAHEALAAEWAARGEAATINPDVVDDIHLTAEGHALWARWLAPRLAAALAR